MNNALTVMVSYKEIRPNLFATVYRAVDPIDGATVEITIMPDRSKIYTVGEYASTKPWRICHDEILTLCGLTA